MELPFSLIKKSLYIACASILLTFAFYFSGLLQTAESWSYDQRMQLARSDARLHNDIAVILIDDASLKALDGIAGNWPWPRSIYAELLDYFSMGEAKAVLFDITFFEKRLFNEDVETINPHDQRLVEATQTYPNTYHALRFVVDEADEINNTLLDQPFPQELLDRLSISQRSQNILGIDNFKLQLEADSNNVFYLPFPELSAAAMSGGVVDMNSDSDGIYRRARLFHRYHDDYFPALSTTALIDNLLPANIVREENSIAFGDLNIPIDDSELLWINYYAHYDTYSFSGIISSLFQIQQGDLENLLVDPATFKDKYVFIGASAAGLKDLKRTPTDANLPGVLIHASIASNILNKEFITPPNKGFTALLITIFSLITAIFSLLPSKNWQKNLAPTIILGSFLLTAIFIYQNTGYVIELVAPSMGLLLSWAIAFSILVFTEGKEKRRFKRMMSQYLSPAVLQTVVNNHEDYAQAEIGSKENITMLFSDIRSFTNMSETMSPEKVVELLNHYFSAMTDSIFHYEGTIDKFIGDAIMAFWGAPVKTLDHADKATLSALDMLHRLEDVNRWAGENHFPPLAIGIGLHTGDAILGNIGSENKLDYTIIGDNVNLASRIEGLTKTYHSQILISEDTHRSLELDIPCLLLDLVRVKGKQQPIRIYRPLAHPELSDREMLDKAHQHANTGDRAFEAYLQRRWDAAISAWRELPEDPAINSMIERCELFKQNPPGDDWDGAHTMTSK